MRAGQATALSSTRNSGVSSTRPRTPSVQGNLQVVYAGLEGHGVFMSPNQGQVWNLMAGVSATR